MYPLKKIPFEDIMVYSPNDADILLRQGYGDYLIIPKKARNHVSPDSEYSEKDRIEGYIAPLKIYTGTDRCRWINKLCSKYNISDLDCDATEDCIRL